MSVDTTQGFNTHVARYLETVVYKLVLTNSGSSYKNAAGNYERAFDRLAQNK